MHSQAGAWERCKVEYSLTEFGKTAIPLLQAIVDWGQYVIEYHGDEE